MKKFIVLIAFVLAAISPAAHAQDEEACPERPAAERRATRWAGRWFVKGERAAKNNKFEKALDNFLCSLYLMPHENTVFNIAQLTNLVDDKQLSADQIRAFREEHPENEFDGELADLVDSLEVSLGIKDDEPLPQQVDEEPQPEPEPTTLPETSEGPSPMAIGGYTLLGTGAAALVTGVVMQVLAGSSRGDAEEATSYDSFQSDKNSMDKRQTGATVLYVTAGILVGTGALLLGLDNRKDEGQEPLEVSLAPAPTGLVLNGEF